MSQNTVLIMIDRWLSSTQITKMQPDEEGGYFRLLLHAASSEDCGLLDDDNELASLSRLGKAWFKKPELSSLTRGQRIRLCFFAKDGHLYNERLLEDRDKYEKNLDSKSKAGAISAERRKTEKEQRNGNKEPTQGPQVLNTCTTDVPTDETHMNHLKRKRTLKRILEDGNERTNEPVGRSVGKHSVEAIAWIRQALIDLHPEAESMPIPDDAICSEIIDLIGDNTFYELAEFLNRQAYPKRTIRTWAWFSTVVRRGFPAHAAFLSHQEAQNADPAAANS